MIHLNRSNLQKGYILLTFLFILVAASTLFFTSNIYNRDTTNTYKNYRQLTEIKNSILNILSTGRDALDLESTYGGINDYPGVISCPERTQDIGTNNEGSSSLRWCHTSSSISTNNFGRIPFRRFGSGKKIDSSGERAWIIVDPTFSHGNLPSTSLTRSINNSTPSNFYWDDGNGPERVVAVILSPNKPLSEQDRSILSSTNPPEYDNYLEISNPTAKLNDLLTGSEVTVSKLDNSNDDFVTITRKDWLDTTQGRVANVVVNCFIKFKEEWDVDNTLAFPTQTSFAKFTTSGSTPSIYQASNDICSNIFNRLEINKSDAVYNNIYERLASGSKKRACCSNSTDEIPTICFNPDDNEYGSTVCTAPSTYTMPTSIPSTVSVSDNSDNEDETTCAMINILPTISGSSFNCSITDCSTSSNTHKAICKNDRWLAQWSEEIYYKANKDDNQDIRIYSNDSDFNETDMLVIVGSDTAPTALPSSTDCSSISNKNIYPYIIIGTDKFCLDEEDRIAYRK